jgi:hypothetical protein
MQRPERIWRLGACALALVASTACSEELGECDGAAARELVYSASGLVATKGQALMHDTCGGAIYCHSSSAKGAQRHGSPRDLDFDMLPMPLGWSTVAQRREEIWTTVVDESMPPRGGGHAKIIDSDWVFDPMAALDRDALENRARLPKLSTDAGKGVMRNWLACGAPVVAQGRLPASVNPGADAEALKTWSGLFDRVIKPKCATAGCHNAASAGGGLALVELCEARSALLEQGVCGEPRIVVGPESGASLLLDKIESAIPRCDDPMPPTQPLPPVEQQAIRAWIEGGALAPECP